MKKSLAMTLFVSPPEFYGSNQGDFFLNSD